MEEVMKPATCPVYFAISWSWMRYLFTAKVIPDVSVTRRTSPMARGSQPDQKPAREGKMRHSGQAKARILDSIF